MQDLIPTTSPLYAKRLVKAVKESFEHGVYLDYSVAHTDVNPRVRDVTFCQAGHIEVQTRIGWFRVLPHEWEHAFFDGYGREIVATRRAK